MSALENIHWFRTPLKMAVPSNSALFEGIGGDFGYSQGVVCLALLVLFGCASHVLKSEAAGLFDRPLVAGCSTGHKPRPLHVNEWDLSQKKKKLHFQYNFPKDDFGHLR